MEKVNTSELTCEHPKMGGLCGVPATYRGMTSGDALCSECADQRKRWATEEIRKEKNDGN